MKRPGIRRSGFLAALLAFAMVFSLASLGMSDSDNEARDETSVLASSSSDEESFDETSSSAPAIVAVESAPSEEEQESGHDSDDDETLSDDEVPGDDTGAGDDSETPGAGDNSGEIPGPDGNGDEPPGAGNNDETLGGNELPDDTMPSVPEAPAPGDATPPVPETPTPGDAAPSAPETSTPDGAVLPAGNTVYDVNNLADGWYTLRVDMIKTNRRDLSMSNDAIGHDVFLSVENGSYYITVTFNSLKIGDSFGYLSMLKYYAGAYIFDKYGNVTGETVPATVMSYQTNADGSYVVDIYNDANNPYPKELKFPLVNRANYEGNFVSLQVFVPIMETISQGSGMQDVLMRLDWPSLKTVEEAKLELPPTDEAEKIQSAPIEKSALKNALDKAGKIKKGNYTDVSYSMLQAVVKAARGVFDNEYSTQNEVDAQVVAIDGAINELKLKPKNSVKKDKALSGRYEVRVDLWHATQGKPSMGNAALNHTAIVDVKGGVYIMSLSTHPMQVGTITACLMSLQVRQKSGAYKYASVIARDNPDGNPSAFRFKLPSKNTYTPVKIDPRVEIMGDKPVDARLRISWDTLVKVSSDKNLSSNTGTTISSGGEAVEEAMSDAVTITDDASGVTVDAGDNLVPEDAGLAVSKIADGEEFDRASPALADVSDMFALFDISLIDKDGAPVQPLGNVKLSIPIPDELSGDISVYRVNDDGTKTFIVAEVSDGKAVFNVNHFSLYALVATDLEAATTVATGNSASAEAGTGSAEAGENLTGDGAAPLSAEPVSNSDAASGGVPVAALIGLAAVCAAVVCGMALRKRVFRGAR
jgi:hypothetical protein